MVWSHVREMACFVAKMEEGTDNLYNFTNEETNHHSTCRGCGFLEEMGEGMTILDVWIWSMFQLSYILALCFQMSLMYGTNGVEESAGIIGKEEVEEPILLLALKDDERDKKSLWYLNNGASKLQIKTVELGEKENRNLPLIWRHPKVQMQDKDTILISLTKIVVIS